MMKISKGQKVLAIILSVLVIAILAVVGVYKIESKTNPRVRLLSSTVYFTEHTLKNPSYLMYGVDIMELLHVYFNGPIEVSGDVALYDVKDLGFSFTMDMEATRSLEQKRLACTSAAEVLGIDAGTAEIYSEDETIYILIPSMDLSFAFPTGMELFKRMPDLTHDIDREWFHENMQNIIEFTGQIKIEETGEYIRETNGEKAEEFKITIPEGTGAFMWELLGMDMPDYDVIVSMYLNSKNHLRRLEIDLSNTMEGASMVIDGEDVGTLLFYYDLPDGEKMHMVMTRLSDKTNTMSMETVYDTNADIHYTMQGNLSWSYDDGDDGVKIKVKEMQIQHGSEVLAKINFNGSVTPLNEEPDVFYGVDTDYLEEIEKLDWKAIRDDVEGFTKDIIAQLKEVRKNK